MIMPALNEEALIGGAIRRARTALEECVPDFEIIVINDGSSDRTGEIVAGLAATDPRIRLLHNQVPMNYGHALKRGFKESRFDWVFHDGADLPLAPSDIPKFAKLFSNSDIVVASRIRRTNPVLWRRLTSFVHNRLVRLLFRPTVADLNFVQFYRRSCLDSLTVLSSRSAFVTPELILRAQHLGLRIREVEVEFQARTRGAGHFGKLDDILWTLKDMLRLRWTTWIAGWDR